MPTLFPWENPHEDFLLYSKRSCHSPETPPWYQSASPSPSLFPFLIKVSSTPNTSSSFFGTPLRQKKNRSSRFPPEKTFFPIIHWRQDGLGKAVRRNLRKSMKNSAPTTPFNGKLGCELRNTLKVRDCILLRNASCLLCICEKQFHISQRQTQWRP